MSTSPRRNALLVLVLATAMLASSAAIVAYAQLPPGDAAQGPFGPPEGVPGPPGGFPGGMAPFAMMGMGSPAIAVSGNWVFVVQGGTLYKFTAEPLELVDQVQFVAPPRLRQPGDGQAGQPGGGRRQRGDGAGPMMSPEP